LSLFSPHSSLIPSLCFSSSASLSSSHIGWETLQSKQGNTAEQAEKHCRAGRETLESRQRNTAEQAGKHCSAGRETLQSRQRNTAEQAGKHCRADREHCRADREYYRTVREPLQSRKEKPAMLIADEALMQHLTRKHSRVVYKTSFLKAISCL
jgi:hypothetical protein